MQVRDDDARPTKIATVTPVSSADRIAAQNDALRRHRTGGRLFLTPGVVRMGDETITLVLDTVARFTAFTADNDPHGEHDFGAFEHDEIRLVWKIDYNDTDLRYGSLDPSDPAVTTRVLTIMLADEY